MSSANPEVPKSPASPLAFVFGRTLLRNEEALSLIADIDARVPPVIFCAVGFLVSFEIPDPIARTTAPPPDSEIPDAFRSSTNSRASCLSEEDNDESMLNDKSIDIILLNSCCSF